MRRIIKGILHRTWKPYVKWYLKSPRTYRWKDITIRVEPEVFHPGFFFSTAFLLRYLQKIKWHNLSMLEIGSGSGLISIWCAKQGANVTACDIHPAAVDNTRTNAATNKVQLSIHQSDLLKNIPPSRFDYIIVNPPYYKKTPQSLEEHAWYCGENLEYFQGLFSQSKDYLRKEGEMLMVLSDECDREGIRTIALNNGWNCEEKKEKLIRWEKNYILSFRSLS